MRPIICGHSLMREINRLRVLNLLRRKDSLSRTELAGETGLDAKTITNLTSDLIKKNLIISADYQDSGGGRPRELLRLNDNLKYSAGIYLSPGQVMGVIVNLKGKIIKEKREILKSSRKFAVLIKQIDSVAKKLLDSIPYSRLFGIGFTFPGIVDNKREMVIQCSNIRCLEGVNIRQNLRKRFKTNIEIEDCSRAMALAEKWSGKAQDIDNFVFVDLGIGIGCAILSRGELHCGASLSAGELGHIVVDINGPLCRCGHYGCLERIASIDEIVNKASDIVNKPLSFDEVIRLNREGNKKIQGIISNAGYYIGVGVSNLINLLNPSHLIVGGELILAGDILFEAMDKAIKEYTVASSYNAVKVIQTGLGEKGGALGAALLNLKKVFEVKEVE